jgi:hypothetical protein
MIKNNKRKLAIDDELKRMFADLKASIVKQQRGNGTRPGRVLMDQHMVPVYRTIKPGGDRWTR